MQYLVWNYHMHETCLAVMDVGKLYFVLVAIDEIMRFCLVKNFARQIR